MFALIKVWRFRPALAQLVAAFLLGACLAATAQPVGEVEFAQGVGFAQTSGQLPRTLGKGQSLMAGDRLTTAPDASAIIKLMDGTRMTLRPDTEVEKGQQLSGLLKKVGMFPELFLQMTAIGEETGHLADMLLSAASSLENDARGAVRRLLALLEPVLILVTSLVVAFIIVSLLLPILNLYEIQF